MKMLASKYHVSSLGGVNLLPNSLLDSGFNDWILPQTLDRSFPSSEDGIHIDCFKMRDELLIGALNVPEEPNPELLHDLHIYAQLRAMDEADLQFQKLFPHPVVLVSVHQEAVIAGFGKKFFLVGMMNASVADQPLKCLFQLWLGLARHKAVVQDVDEIHKILVVIIQQLHSDVHLTGPGNERHLRRSFPERSLSLRLRKTNQAI